MDRWNGLLLQNVRVVNLCLCDIYAPLNYYVFVRSVPLFFKKDFFLADRNTFRSAKKHKFAFANSQQFFQSLDWIKLHSDFLFKALQLPVASMAGVRIDY